MRRYGWALAALVGLTGCVSEPEEPLGQSRQAVSAPLAQAYCSIVVSGKGEKQMETDYLPHVITCENGGANLQALKAQAIAARSVAYYAIATSGSICDGQGCQVYSCGAAPQAKHYQAVQETAGQYLSYGGMLTYGFYVAGDSGASPPGCKDYSGSTSGYVTYNEGKTGTSVTQTSLGYIGPPGYGQNRGCMSQWGARCLENSNGYDFTKILQFYFGADINILQGSGPCVVSCEPKPETCNGQDDDCNGTADDGEVCTIEQVIVPTLALIDGRASSDIDGDGRADVCARSSAGLTCHRSIDAGVSDSIAGPELSDASGWGELRYFSTLRMGDLDGDGKADLCARAAAGIDCWLGDGTGFPTHITGPIWSDTNGWDARRFFATLRLADIDGDGTAEVCARSASDFRCHKLEGNAFGEPIIGPALSDDSGWGIDKYFSTIRMADVNGDGKDDICARHSQGFSCWKSDGAGFGSELVGPALSDANGWGEPRYYATIRMADVDGDGDADLCARHSQGFSCWKSDGESLGTEIVGPTLSDASGWGAAKYWSTIRMGDVDGDGSADVCARAAAGFHCWLSDGAGFPTEIAMDELSDAKGWDDPIYYTTLRLADMTGDGKADICARGSAGVSCWPSNGAGFDAPIAGPEWSNASGWGDTKYYSTLQIASSPAAPSTGGAGGGWGTGGAGGASASAGTSAGGHAGNPLAPDGESDAGCACRTKSSPSAWPWSLMLFALALLRRRRRDR
jgi:MYXO-CTERM domain-containing protein